MPGSRQRQVLTLAVIALVAAMAGAGVTTAVIRGTSAASSTGLASGGSNSAGSPSGTGPSGGKAGPGGGTEPGEGTGPFNGSGPFGGTLPGQGDQPGAGSGTGSPGQHSTAPGSPAGAAAIARKVDPGLVDINTTLSYQGLQGAGTGMVLTPSGEILTNNHVIEGETKISVTDIGNGKTYGATVVGYDRSRDVAILQLTGASGLTTVTTGDSSTVHTGDGVVAIGNAGGAGGTPSWAGGSVTGLNRTITATDAASGTSERLHGLIETNAGIISGDSGGPLVDSAGRVIGMDTAASQSFRFSSGTNQGYAIPVNEALSIAKQIEAGRSSSTVHIGPTAFLGAGVQSVAAGSGSAGAQIVSVVPGGAAAQAGLGPGDTITSFAGDSVTSPTALIAVLLREHPGASVQVHYLDSAGRGHTVTVHLASGPPQ